MIVQAMWINDSPLLQIMDQNLAQKIELNHGIKEISDFVEMDEGEREKALKGNNISQIADACNRYPMVSLVYKILGE